MLFFKLCVSLAVLGFMAFARAAEGQEEASSSAALTESQKATEEWLKAVDEGNYAKSHQSASSLFQGAISESEWSKYLEGMRKPFGKVVSRKLTDQRTAKDPKGLPQGDYMVIVYESAFSNGKAVELATLISTEKGWKILTYQISESK